MTKDLASEFEGCLEQLEKHIPDEGGWARLSREGGWKAVQGELDQVIAEQPENHEARLWWVLAQLNVGGIPVSAMSAPLEQIVLELKSEEELAPLSTLAFLSLGARLLERENGKLAVIMLERAADFSLSAHELPHELQEGIWTGLSTVISSEIKRVELLPHERSYRDWLDERRTHLELVAPHPEKKKEEKKKEKQTRRRTTFDSRSLAPDMQFPEEEEDEREETQKEDRKTSKKAFAEDTPGEEEAASFDDGEHVASQSKVRSGERSPALIVTAAFLLILFGLWGVSKVFWSGSAEPKKDVLARFDIPEGKHTTLATPEVKPRSGNESGSATDFIAELSKVRERLKQKPDSDPDTQPEDYETTATLEASYAQAVTGGQGIETLPPSENTEPESDPGLESPGDLSSERLSSISHESLGTTQQRTAHENIAYDPVGRRIGLPPEEIEGVRGLDGKKVQAYEVKRFKDIRVYRVVASTPVLSSPSVVAYEDERLEPGAKVHATSSLGPWIELRSTGGRRGYVRVQDLQYVEDLKEVRR